MTAIKKDVTPVSGIVNVLLEHQYTLLDSTPTCWVFESKHPETYAFALPATRKLVPVEMVRQALRSEPLDVDAVVEQSVEKSDEEAARRYYAGEDPVVLDEEEVLKALRETPLRRTEISEEDMRFIQEFTDRIEEESLKVRDEDRVDVSGNLKYYLSGGE